MVTSDLIDDVLYILKFAGIFQDLKVTVKESNYEAGKTMESNRLDQFTFNAK